MSDVSVDPTLPRCGTDLIATERRPPNVDPPATRAVVLTRAMVLSAWDRGVRDSERTVVERGRVTWQSVS
jgi:hypothetical protein